jgi:SAM-dependent methyltransferase
MACLFNFLQGRGFRYIDVTEDPAAFPRGKRDSDCTPAQWRAALDLIAGESVLDIGCGSGSFVKLVAEKGFTATGVDPWGQPDGENNWRVLKGYAENSGFPEKAFDTVLSFKTLEHIPDARSTLEFWRTLARRRLILLLPCQRYRRFGYDGHVNFYPDEYQLRIQLRLKDNASITKVDNEWLVSEDMH